MIKKIYRLVFILGSILILLGMLFKILHWPGSKISLFIGYGLIGFLFTPIYFSYKFKMHSTKLLKRLDLIGIICLFSLSTGSILNLSDIKFGYYIALFGYFILVLLFIPFLTFIVIKEKENRFKRIIILSFSVIYAGWSLYFLLSFVSLKSSVLDSVVLVDQGIELENQNNQSQADYGILLLNNKDSIKIQTLRQKSDSIQDYIQTLKIKIISDFSKEGSNEDSLLNEVLFKEKRAFEIKRLIDDYRNFIINNFNDSIDNHFINERLSTNVKNPNQSKSWEDENFNHLPLVAVTSIFSNIQSEVKSIENKIIEQLKK